MFTMYCAKKSKRNDSIRKEVKLANRSFMTHIKNFVLWSEEFQRLSRQKALWIIDGYFENYLAEAGLTF